MFAESIKSNRKGFVSTCKLLLYWIFLLRYTTVAKKTKKKKYTTPRVVFPLKKFIFDFHLITKLFFYLFYRFTNVEIDMAI